MSVTEGTKKRLYGSCEGGVTGTETRREFVDVLSEGVRKVQK